MLKRILQHHTKIDIDRDFHRHVPIGLKVKKATFENPLYWRLIDGDRALLEIGIQRRTGEFHSLTLVTFLKAADPGSTLALEAGEEFAVPCFDLDPWPLRTLNRPRFDHFDWQGTLKLGLSTNQATLKWSVAPARHIISLNPRLIFGFDETDCLIQVSILDLTNSEMAALIEGLG